MFQSTKNIKLALLISGGGTTMQAIISACRDGRLKNIKPALIIASNKNAGGITLASTLGFPEENIVVINPRNFKTRELFGEEIIKECKKRKVNLLGQYGWMVLTPENVIKKFKNKIINQHPGPLDEGRPDFGGHGMYGLRVHQARLEFVKRTNRDFFTEATAHFVNKEFDKGEVIKRQKIPILENDTAETLQARVLKIEYETQIEALKDFSKNKIKKVNRKKPLVLKGEEKILEECKKLAIKMYPNG